MQFDVRGSAGGGYTVWVHGYGGSPASFGAVPAALPGAHVLVSYGVDTPFARLAVELAAWLAAHAHVPLRLHGHSLGGLVVLAAWEQCDAQTRGAVAGITLWDTPMGGVGVCYLYNVLYKTEQMSANVLALRLAVAMGAAVASVWSPFTLLVAAAACWWRTPLESALTASVASMHELEARMRRPGDALDPLRGDTAWLTDAAVDAAASTALTVCRVRGSLFIRRPPARVLDAAAYVELGSYTDRFAGFLFAHSEIFTDVPACLRVIRASEVLPGQDALGTHAKGF